MNQRPTDKGYETFGVYALLLWIVLNVARIVVNAAESPTFSGVYSRIGSVDETLRVCWLGFCSSRIDGN
jgi:hypothetical protein